MPAAQVAIVRLARRRSTSTDCRQLEELHGKGDRRKKTDREIAGAELHEKAGQKHSSGQRAHGFTGKRVVEDQPKCPLGVSRSHRVTVAVPKPVCIGCCDLRAPKVTPNQPGGTKGPVEGWSPNVSLRI